MGKSYKVKIEVHDNQALALFAGNYSDVKGCPMGRGKNGVAAMHDLCYRTNFESNLEISIGDLIVDKRYDCRD